MPKDIITTKRDGRVFHSKSARKFKIGGRKSGKSAHTMSSEALLAIVNGEKRTGDSQNARAVLTLRGVAV